MSMLQTDLWIDFEMKSSEESVSYLPKSFGARSVSKGSFIIKT